MSETQAAEKEDTQKPNQAGGAIELNSLFAFKVGMSSYYDDKGEMQSATVLRYEPMLVSQIKSKEKDGYVALQLAFCPKRAKRTTKSEKNHLKATDFENGAYFVREIRQAIPEGAAIGSRVSIDSLKIGDRVKVTGTSKGKGFMGVVRRWNNAGGPAAHGSGFHRSPGSSGNRTWPGRVMPGKKFPGHLGDETVTVKNLDILDVIPEENVIIVRGAVPGAQNSLIKLSKV